ncbi:Cubilin [Nymphon striatum]|nr:Cubilin [Nymphon striatum]
MAGVYGHIAEFKEGMRWKSYCERMEQIFVANGITDADIKRAILLSTVGEILYSLIKSLLSLAFIDYKKAFDSVEHQAVLNALNAQNISPAYIRMLDQIFRLGTSNIKLHNNTNKIRLEKGKCGSGVNPYDQPRILSEDGHLTIIAAYNHNITMKSSGSGAFRVNDEDLSAITKNLLTKNECNSNPCLNGGTCVDVFNGFLCKCPANWMGSTCSVDVNECQIFVGTDLGCQNGATCQNTVGGYRCKCTANRFGVHCTQTHDDCNSASNDALCGHGTCINVARVQPGQPKYHCICEQGWTTRAGSPACDQDVDECSSNNPGCSTNPPVQCINVPGSFYCGSCPSGYSGSGYSCSDINECERNNGGCSLHPRVECINTLGSRTCGACPTVCGGELEEVNFGSINSPGYPGLYPHRRDCYWIVKVPRGKRIQFNFATLKIEHHSNCSFDFLKLYDGILEFDPVLKTYCTSSIPPPITTSGSRALLHFHSDPSKNDQGFHITYFCYSCQAKEKVQLWRGANCVPGCGGTLTKTRGSLSSPNFPDQYPNGLLCDWLIRIHPEEKIELTFTKFDIEDHSSCKFDYVEAKMTVNNHELPWYSMVDHVLLNGTTVFDRGGPWCLTMVTYHGRPWSNTVVRDGANENSRSLGRHCGNTIPSPVHSNGNTLWVRFRADDSIIGNGFKANYITKCGGVYQDSTGVLKSPYYPATYPNNKRCIYIISCQIEFSDNCNSDYVRANDTSGAVIGRYCGATIPPVLTSSGREISVEFRADESQVFEGFSAAYSFVNGSSLCGANYFTDSGVIKSPNFPNYYPHHRNCIWNIKVKEGHQIMLNVTDFHLENNTDCKYDFLEIRNGDSVFAPLIGKYCGVDIPKLIPSHTNVLRIQFKTDTNQAAPGFRIYYDGTTTGCGGILTGPSGSIWSPNYPQAYGHNAECTWQIFVAQGSSIMMNFIDFDIEAGESCRFDYLDIYKGKDDLGRKFGRYCNKKKPNTLTINKNSAFLKFSSDHSNAGKGFHLKYHANCTNEIHSRKGVIETPNFPNRYPHNRNCTWKIVAPIGNNVSLSFSHFILEDHTQCVYDYVKIMAVYGGRHEKKNITEVVKFCGTDSPPSRIDTNASVVLINFVSDGSIALNGFRLEFVTTGCGGDFTRRYGTFTSPNYPSSYMNEIECIWTITVPEGSQIALRISEYDMELESNCVYDFLKVYRDAEDSQPLHTICGTSSQQVLITSPGSHLYIVFKSDSIITRKGFRARYSAVPGVCGGRISADHGTIMSTNYPQPYPLNSDCSWAVAVPNNHLVSLKFNDFDLGPSTNCTDNYVALNSGQSVNDYKIMKHCGNILPNPDTYVALKCGARINVDSGSGVITSPGYPHKSLYYECNWILYTEKAGGHIILTFTNMHFENRSVSANCSETFLEIRDGDSSTSPLKMKTCLKSVPPSIVSVGSALHIQLKKESKYAVVLFRAVYSEATSNCGGTMMSPEGSFTSPNYPNSYQPLYECIWILKASRGSLMQLSFSFFNLEESSYCNKDYVEVRDGSTWSMIGRYCGSNIPSNLTVANKIWIKFRSSEAINGQGFVAQYSMLKYNEMSSNYGTIDSPGFPTPYFGDGTFKWLITAPNYRHIKLRFNVLEIEDVQGCHSNVQIFDGADETGIVRGKYCGYNRPSPIYSHGNQFLIKFVGRSDKASTWRITDVMDAARDVMDAVRDVIPVAFTGCGSDFLIPFTTQSPNKTVITSPGYPNGYKNNLSCEYYVTSPIGSRVYFQIADMKLTQSSWSYYCSADRLSVYDICGGSIYKQNGLIEYVGTSHSNCVWTIHVGQGRTISIDFEEFSIPSDSGCTGAHVMLRNGENYDSPFLGNGKYCGSTIPTIPPTVSNNVRIALYPGGKAINLKIRFKEVSVSCGGSFYLDDNTPSETIKSPNYPNPMPHDAECVWIIMGPAAHSLNIEFNSLFETDPNCWKDYVEVRDGGTIQAPRIDNKLCGKISPKPRYTTQNLMFIRYVTSATTPRAGFSAVVTIAKCGGLLPGYSGSFTSPNFPNNYTNNLDCFWHIHLHQIWMRLELNIVSLDLPLSANCSTTDNVEIRDHNSTGNILGTFCGSNIPGSIDTISNAAYIRFRSDSTKVAKGFNITYKYIRDDCSGEFYTPSGVITSPNGRKQVYCWWKIQVTPGRRIKLHFTYFDLPSDQNYFTYSLKIVDGLDYYGYTTKIKQNPIDFESSGNTLTIAYSAGSHQQRGFSFQYTSDEEAVCSKKFTSDIGQFVSPNFMNGYNDTVVCSKTFTSDIGQFVSPNFMNGYNDTVGCQWYLPRISSANTTIVINFEQLKTQYDSNGTTTYRCVRHDYASIQKPLARYRRWDIASYCGNFSLPPKYVSYGKDLIINYVQRKPDNNYSGYGVKGSYKINFSLDVLDQLMAGTGLAQVLAVTYAENDLKHMLTDCGGKISGFYNDISSPNYPSNYPMDSDCYWKISAPGANKINVTFSEFKLESDCKKDYLIIRNGGYSDSPIIGTYCGESVPPSFISETSNVILMFHSDNSGSAKGFRFTTETVHEGCGGLIHGRYGYIKSKNYPDQYPNNIECEWRLVTEPSYFYNLTFVNRFDVEKHADCENDYVQVSEHISDENWKLVGKFCGFSIPIIPISKSNILKIKFHSNQAITGNGFYLRYKKACGSYFYGDSGVISSPNFPESYPFSTRCEYVIKAKPGTFVHLVFDPRFDIEGKNGYCHDSLKIYRGKARYFTRRLCGKTQPSRIMMRGETRIVFSSDSIVSGKGFKLHYDIKTCGGNLTNSTGVITSPAYPNVYKYNSNCTWYITVPSQNVIDLRFNAMSIKYDSNCRHNVKVFDGNSLSTQGQGCGGIINATAGLIKSVDIDNDGKYENYLDCIWKIAVPTGKVIKFTFSSFSVEKSAPNLDACSNDYLELRDGYFRYSATIDKLCGTHIPETKLSASNTMFIHFHSDDNVTEAGFIANFEAIDREYSFISF